ncbi:MAG: transcription termination factor Rho [Ellagibacter isourolithinifaciens]|uniref:transcription termination factor Rho n=1 Tax=Ellagibacter isourolithinifaciens TaxID=2137581 RepID=UPI002E78E8D4|nr:transcription termination factor Rho [Ellagibacter isourolithinifaciens]MEE1455216.1 transcription termination factor Rho [Ellagibacter isourolithinifaciens]
MSDNEVAETKAAEASEAPKKAADNTTSASPVKRGPGRPRKVKAEAAEAPAEAKPKRGPGRPRKTPVVSEAAESASTPASAKAAKAAAQSTSEAPAEEKPKRRPGRPRKNPLPVDAEGSSKGAPVRAAETKAGEAPADGESKTAKPAARKSTSRRSAERASDADASEARTGEASKSDEQNNDQVPEASSSNASHKDSSSPSKTTVHVRRSRGEQNSSNEQKQSGKNHSGYNKDRNNNQKQYQQKHGNDRKQRRGRNQQNREITPSVNREELAALKVAELRAKAAELELDVTGLKKAELVDAVYEASVKAEGFIEVSGILDIMPDGYGFLRTQGYLPSETDAYVGLSMIRRNGLRKGDMICGQTRPARENEKFAAIQKLISINGKAPEEGSKRPKFSDLTPVYPDERLIMEHGKSTITARVIDLAAPIGKGQRGLIVSPPKAGKTTILKDIAASITANNPEVHLMCLLVDERPEEVTDMERSVRGEVVSSTFDMPCENHIAVSELVIERAKRLVEMGEDVVILLDSITRLARAYNLAQPASGRILSGGVDSTALYPPKRFLGAARNIEGGGSLTILASALIDTGSKMDEVIFEEFKGTGNMELKLDRNLADRRIFPAIDPVTSGTRKEDLLLDPQEAPLIWAVRRILSNMNNTERAMDMLIKSLKRTETNQEFLLRTAKKAQSAHGKVEDGFEL